MKRTRFLVLTLCLTIFSCSLFLFGACNPNPATDENYIYFGEYPQTIKADSVTITETVNEKGYCLGSDNEWYAKVTAKPYSSAYTFTNSATIKSGTVYYFKVEPIKWQILSQEEDTLSVVCASIIANKRYDDSSNNYANSEIRAWLNNEFYNTAFSDLQKELIVTTEVDNGLESTCYSSNDYICENTYDNVYLLSVREAYFMDRTWNDSQARQKMATDYAKAMGVWLGEDTHIGYGWWWLRSPCAALDRGAVVVGPSGTLEYYSFIYRGDEGVVPALQLMAK